MITGNYLGLLTGNKSPYSSQMALFGLAKPAASAASADVQSALADRINNSQQLTKADKQGLSRLMNTVEQFAKGDSGELMAKVSAIAGMMEMLNSSKGVTGEPYNAANALADYWKVAGADVNNEAVTLAPSLQITSMLEALKARLAQEG